MFDIYRFLIFSKERMYSPTIGFKAVLDSLCLGLFINITKFYALVEHKTLKIAHYLKEASEP